MCALPISRRRGDPEPHEAEAAFESIWRTRVPTYHAFAADYRKLASRLIAALLNAGAGHRFRDAQPLAINFPNGRVLVEPNELAELSDGTVVIRRVRTGYKRRDEYDRLEYTLYHLAARRSDERRVGKECVSTCRSRCSPSP